MSASRNKRKRGGGRFARLPVAVLGHVSVTTLPHAAFRVLVLLAAQFTGYNNGSLGLTAKQASAAGIGSDRTLYSSMRNLESRRLIQMTYPASRVPPRPTMWALTWLPSDDTRYTQSTRKPSNAYRTWKPEKVAA